MQISIYLDNSIIKKVDQKAKKTRQSRSRFIQSILEKEILDKKKESVFDEVFGILDRNIADKLIHSIHSNRVDSQRFR